jgi:hypothetical protein
MHIQNLFEQKKEKDYLLGQIALVRSRRPDAFWNPCMRMRHAGRDSSGREHDTEQPPERALPDDQSHNRFTLGPATIEHRS